MSRSPRRRAPSMRPSTRANSNCPSSGSNCIHDTGANTVLKFRSTIRCQMGSMYARHDELELCSSPPSTRKGLPSTMSCMALPCVRRCGFPSSRLLFADIASTSLMPPGSEPCRSSTSDRPASARAGSRRRSAGRSSRQGRTIGAPPPACCRALLRWGGAESRGRALASGAFTPPAGTRGASPTCPVR